MVDINTVDKALNKALKEMIARLPPEDRESTKPTRVLKKNYALHSLIEQAFIAHDMYESGEIKNSDKVISVLHEALNIAMFLMNEAIANSSIIEDRERYNSDLRYFSASEKGIKEGIKRQRKKHGSNTSPFREHEPLIIELFNNYQEAQSGFSRYGLGVVKAKITTETGLQVAKSTFEGWRKNYLNSLGKTIFTP